MGDRSAIEWTDATWNPVRGCSRVSPGCGGPGRAGGCYAEGVAARFSGPGQPFHGFAERDRAGSKWTGKVALIEKMLGLPLHWKQPRRIFVNSMSDLFHETLPDEAIDKVFAIMALCPQHTFQVLTKRPERMRGYMANLRAHASAEEMSEPSYLLAFACESDAWEEANCSFPPWPLPNVWLGVSVEDQERADERIPLLLDTPSAMRFLSCEPLLAPVDLSRLCILPKLAGSARAGIHIDALRGRYCESGVVYKGEWDINSPPPPDNERRRIDWVICGGESGPNARPMSLAWARSLRDQCATASVPFFFKQWGEWHSAAYDMRTAEPRFRTFATFEQWVDKASTWVNGGICLDKGGVVLRDGGDFMRARDENRFPVTIMHKVGKKRAGRMLDGRTHDDFPAEGAAS